VIEDLASYGMIFVQFFRQSLGNLGVPATHHHKHRNQELFQLYGSPKNTQA